MRFIRHYLLAAAACAIVLLFTLFAYNRSVKAAADRREKLFEVRTNEALKTVRNRMMDYIQILKGGQGLFIANDTVTREIWRSYYNALEVNRNYPGVQGIGYACYVPGSDLDNFTSHIRSEGFPEFKVTPEGQREHNFPILYIEPFESRNLRAFGYDMYSEPVRREAMQRAWETGNPSLSGKVKLMQETTNDVQPGFLIYLPLYKKDHSAGTTIEGRRKNILGFVYAPFRSYDLMGHVLANEFRNIDIEIFDGEKPSTETLLYNKDLDLNFGSPSSADVNTRLVKITVADHVWSIYFSADESFGSNSDRSNSQMILAGGLIISLLLFSAVAAMANTNRRAMDLAREMTSKLRESEQQVNNIFRNAPDAVVVIDKDSNVMKWNPKAERLFGWSEEEMIGKPIYDYIIPHKYREAHKLGMDHFLHTGEGPVLNRTIEISALNRSGEEFEIELSISYTKEVTGNPVFIAFIADIRERKRTEAELIRKTVDLSRSRELERKKDEFLGIASHELKTPLTSVKAYVQLLARQLEEENASETSKQYIKKTNNYVDKLNGLIRDLLDATRIQGGKLQLDLTEISMNDFVRDCIETMQHVSKTHRIIFEQGPDAVVNADKQRLEQVMVNLLTNAVKYSPRADKVHVTTVKTDDEFKVGVRDFGIGISEENSAKIFSRFYRVEKDSSLYPGLGLGLYISRQIIERHNGSLWVESEPDKGSVFYFTLPLKR